MANSYLIVEFILLSFGLVAEIFLLLVIYTLLHRAFLHPMGTSDSKAKMKRTIFLGHVAICGVLGILYLAYFALGIKRTVELVQHYGSATLARLSPRRGGIPDQFKIYGAYQAIYFVASIEIAAACFFLMLTASKRGFSFMVSVCSWHSNVFCVANSMLKGGRSARWPHWFPVVPPKGPRPRLCRSLPARYQIPFKSNRRCYGFHHGCLPHDRLCRCHCGCWKASWVKQFPNRTVGSQRASNCSGASCDDPAGCSTTRSTAILPSTAVSSTAVRQSPAIRSRDQGLQWDQSTSPRLLPCSTSTEWVPAQYLRTSAAVLSASSARSCTARAANASTKPSLQSEPSTSSPSASGADKSDPATGR